MNLCTKPSCARPGAAVLAFDYGKRRALLEDPVDGELSPHVYVLCTRCAENLRPPRGWELDDVRAKPPLFADPRPDPLVATDSAESDGDGDSSALRRQLFFGYSA